MKTKSNKTISKRFKVSKTGKLMHSVGQWNHLRGKKSAQVRYRKRAKRNLAKGMTDRIRLSLTKSK